MRSVRTKLLFTALPLGLALLAVTTACSSSSSGAGGSTSPSVSSSVVTSSPSGSSENSSSSVTGSSETVSSPATGSTAATDDALAKVKAAGVLKVGIAVDPPFTLQKADGTFYSFNPELVEDLGKAMGVKIQFVPAAWATIVAGLQAGQYDIIGASISATEERKKAIDFTDPYAEGGNSWLVLANSPYKTIDDLNNSSVTVAFASGTFQEQATEAHLPKAKTRAIQNLSYATLVPELTANHSNAISVPSYLAVPLAQKFGLRAIPALADGSPDPAGVDPTGVAWGVRKGDDSLKNYLNSFIAGAKSDGTIDALMKKDITPENAVS